MNKLIIILLFSLVSITWGTTWIAMKIAVETIPPLFATGLRFLIASPLLIMLSYYTKNPLLFPQGQRFFQLMIAIFYFSIPFTLMLYGGIDVSSSIASIIFSSMPVAVLTVSCLYFKQKLFLTQKVGLIISLITLCIVLLIELESNCFFQWKGILALLFALFSHAMIYATCQKKCYSVSVITFNALPSLLSGIILSTISWFTESPHFDTFSNRSILAVIYLGDFSGIFGILSYFYLQQKVSAFYASTVFLIFPIIAGFLESYFYSHTILLCEMWFIFPLLIGILLTLIPVKNFQKEKI
ncbi:DMT family transporter [Buchnera aphidicola]|uniref:Yeda n=1 Tax=Buchnera aphidicola str. USDA (Myzus persicae) TaxID=1009856 RepID=W0P010_BUCMP|nr:DMT family transporter [Buchnera aphidicola]AHG60101.1 Yeda [Buchnera aphidicola str. USDA (Myzus persicae)]AHG60681.1 Yeda [Buchnera aphidicola str. W106 (Myzus persicae)]AHG61253.1 Yeda [Buchnera aphidicola str. G002 (Myzus persicae)]AHG61826.1 Yeda [Buchnera aphidicola str. F009 (Myzus persicae)]WAI03210.1 MAG: DMT family transporter [Buchnera aphidicola (Myzus persicae)]